MEHIHKKQQRIWCSGGCKTLPYTHVFCFFADVRSYKMFTLRTVEDACPYNIIIFSYFIDGLSF